MDNKQAKEECLKICEDDSDNTTHSPLVFPFLFIILIKYFNLNLVDNSALTGYYSNINKGKRKEENENRKMGKLERGKKLADENQPKNRNRNSQDFFLGDSDLPGREISNVISRVVLPRY